MEYKKDDLLTLTIEDMGVDGSGIGKQDGFTVFVKDALMGDQVRVKLMKVQKTYGYGKLQEVLKPSPYRVDAPCPIAGPCGGCQIQGLSYEKQLEYKANKVRGNLERIGKLSFSQESGEGPVFEPILGMETPFRYRNKAQYPVGRDKSGKMIAGFYAGRTHSIIECEDCLLGDEQDGQVLRRVLEYMNQYQVPPYEEKTGKGLVRHILIRRAKATGELLVCLVVNGRTLPKEKALVEKLSSLPGLVGICLNENRKSTNVILGEKLRVIYGRDHIEDELCGLRFRIHPLSFFQVNHDQTERLYEKALSYAGLTGKERVWDLYCGIGTISLLLARHAKEVVGVEVVPQAIDNARENALRNGIENASFLCGEAQEVFVERYERDGAGADVIVVDPPRKGCEESVLRTMVQMSPERIVYVSCDSATLARDLAYLEEHGYRTQRVCPVDMFPNSVHVETVCLLSNRKPDTKVRIDVDLEDYYRIKDAKKNQN